MERGTRKEGKGRGAESEDVKTKKKVKRRVSKTDEANGVWWGRRLYWSTLGGVRPGWGTTPTKNNVGKEVEKESKKVDEA